VVVTGSVGLDESTLVDEIFFVLCGISVLSITNNDNCNIIQVNVGGELLGNPYRLVVIAA
jgi:hypothetical protein